MKTELEKIVKEIVAKNDWLNGNSEKVGELMSNLEEFYRFHYELLLYLVYCLWKDGYFATT